jgi:hypothetical protein
MRSKNWLSELLQESSYKIYLEQQPALVEIIRKGLLAGETPKTIKMFCEKVAGKSLTSNCVGYMIDYINKSYKNETTGINNFNQCRSDTSFHDR